MTAVASTIPAGLDADGMSPEERRQYEMLRAHRVMGLLMQRVPLDIPMTRWSVGDSLLGFRVALVVEGSVGIMPTDHASRAAVMKLAEQLNLTYSEEPHGDSRNIVSATGRYNGVHVKLFDLVKPCTCGCGGAL